MSAAFTDNGFQTLLSFPDEFIALRLFKDLLQTRFTNFA
jgi:hypothetical protein